MSVNRHPVKHSFVDYLARPGGRIGIAFLVLLLGIAMNIKHLPFSESIIIGALGILLALLAGGVALGHTDN